RRFSGLREVQDALVRVVVRDPKLQELVADAETAQHRQQVLVIAGDERLIVELHSLRVRRGLSQLPRILQKDRTFVGTDTHGGPLHCHTKRSLPADSPSPAVLRQLLHGMLRIRTVEETIAELYAEQEMRCPVHLCSGQEAVAAGVCAALQNDDYAMGAH